MIRPKPTGLENELRSPLVEQASSVSSTRLDSVFSCRRSSLNKHRRTAGGKAGRPAGGQAGGQTTVVVDYDRPKRTNERTDERTADGRTGNALQKFQKLVAVADAAADAAAAAVAENGC